MWWPSFITTTAMEGKYTILGAVGLFHDLSNIQNTSRSFLSDIL